MNPRQSRRAVIVVSVALACIIVVIGATVVMGEWLLERWYLEKLESRSPQQVEGALRNLGDLGSREGFVRALRRCVELSPDLIAIDPADRYADERESERKLWFYGTLEMCQRMGTVELVRAVTETLRDPQTEVEVRAAAIRFLGMPPVEGLQTKAHDAVAVLSRALSAPDPLLRANAAITLGDWGADAAEVVPELEKLLEAADEEDADVCRAAAMALEKIREGQEPEQR